MIGQVFGNYKIEQKLGEGGMGEVYRGVDLMLEREVAIKVLRPELAGQPALVERFRTEAVALAKLYHPNIATLHSFFRQADGFYMVMEFVRGETLDSLLRRRGALGCAEALPLFCQALEGIHYAHGFGIIHRDIKPGNVMIDPSGRVKVMDFGIARVLGTSRMTRTGFMIGTPEYMSPEQVLGEETGARSDIYSLGILLYEMLTGRVPFTSTSEFKLMKAQTEEPPPPLRAFAPHTPEAIERAVMRALAKDPSGRFATADEFRTTLLAASGPRPAAVSPAPPRETRAAFVTPTATPPRAAGAAEPPARHAGQFTLTAAAKYTRPPLLSRLNRKHYAGLAAAALAAAAVMPFALGGRGGETDPAAAEAVKLNTTVTPNRLTTPATPATPAPAPPSPTPDAKPAPMTNSTREAETALSPEVPRPKPTPAPVASEPEPPPAPAPQPKPRNIVSGGVLNGRLISKPQPAYPPIAKAARASGTVTVQVLVDESGRVVSASAVSGHPLLQQAAVSAARQARFSPTLLSGQPVKVSGVVTYNFVLQ